jgi:hypothetical protein
MFHLVRSCFASSPSPPLCQPQQQPLPICVTIIAAATTTALPPPFSACLSPALTSQLKDLDASSLYLEPRASVLLSILSPMPIDAS